MNGRKVCCTITLIMLCLLIVNFFLPIASDGYESISLFDYLTEGVDSEGGVIVVGAMLVCVSFLIFAIVDCIICLCSVNKDYKYSLAAIPLPMFIYLLFASLFIFLDSGRVHISIAGILGPILSIASLVLIFVGNALGNKKNTYNSFNNYQNNTPSAKIKGYDPMTGKPIYATFKGYNTQTGEPIYD